MIESCPVVRGQNTVVVSSQLFLSLLVTGSLIGVVINNEMQEEQANKQRERFEAKKSRCSSGRGRRDILLKGKPSPLGSNRRKGERIVRFRRSEVGL
ncbi:hypothetical protein B296_00022822 [Ensete ventricosum]|uniref:Uncharacterized protein n=1 Tax=Ensete ventricosum TaxID=4639 RepID=A0A426XHG7_ENSVE|nr:hypothetical protein B296_00022822 [Ensete ventricosum]